MAADPQFVNTPVLGMGVIATANTARDGTGTLVTVVTGGGNGTRISRVRVKAQATTTAGMVRLFVGDDAATPNIRLFDEIAVSAVTPSGTVESWEAEAIYGDDLVLPANYTLRAAPQNAETFNVIALGGNF